jgi:hypothetical protein
VGYTPIIIGHKSGVAPSEPIKAVKDKIPKLEAKLFEKLNKVGFVPSLHTLYRETGLGGYDPSTRDRVDFAHSV